jgi:hypothetical protein
MKSSRSGLLGRFISLALLALENDWQDVIPAALFERLTDRATTKVHLGGETPMETMKSLLLSGCEHFSEKG